MIGLSIHAGYRPRRNAKVDPPEVKTEQDLPARQQLVDMFERHPVVSFEETDGSRT